MKAVKIIAGVLVAIVAIVAIVLVVGLQNLDKIVKSAVEELGPQVMGSSVTLDEVKITLTEGRGELRGLNVGNPKGFSSANALSMGEVALEIDPASVTGPVIVINEVLISNTQLLAELKGLKDSNLQALYNNVRANTAGSGKAQAQPAAGDQAEVRLAVKKFTFADGSIQLVSDQLGEKTLKLPAIRLRDLGSVEQGLTPDELAAAVMQPILAAAKEAVQDYVEGMAKDKAKEALKDKLSEKLGEDGAEKLDQLKSLFNR
ncbi:MAG: hypothetical protein GYB33_16200 [Gammaproteobacteria bacterium]|uniref:DUF748 domain-containing protein n=1 Tax=Pseudomaricurvus alcaniphilus TaxID=1166482 RepID=UPI00140771BD|nr:hypothetical protein [Pseudomaricurvus alcaniphilus]MBR9911887.1 hypothetical protein [Gammaproteobacteria bacterium]NHN36062.1 hypothetical protein [Pseudomaricurvus alcaniphilus]